MIFEKALVDLFYQDMLTTLCGMLAEKADLVWCRKFVKVGGLGGRERCACVQGVRACKVCVRADLCGVGDAEVKCMNLGWW